MNVIAIKALPLGVLVALGGCTDLKPLQANLDDLKAQVGKLQSSVAAARSAAESASRAASQAGQSAAGAQSTANQALAESRSEKSSIEGINARIDRIFKKSVAK